MPFDAEKTRLEARLLGLLNQALQDRNRDEIVSSTLALGDLYLSGDLYEKAEESFQRVLQEPVQSLARPDEKARAHISLATIAMRRGHLTLAAEGLQRVRDLMPGPSTVGLEARRLQSEIDLYAGRYREVVDAVETILGSESPDKLGDLRIDFMLLQGRARRLQGRNARAERHFEKALDLAQKTGYEAGTAGAHSELGRVLTVVGKFKRAQEHLQAALKSDAGMGSQLRLDVDHRRLALLLLRMGRWAEAEELLQQSCNSSRDLGIVESRIGSQLVRANMLRLRGSWEEAQDQAQDAMETARAAGFLRRQVQGLLCTAWVTVDRGEADAALESLRQAEALYGRVAPESNVMLQVHVCTARAYDLRGETAEAFDHFMRANNIARETASEIERHVVDSHLGEHFRARGEEEKAADLLTRAARELGALGAKFDVARARLGLARLLCDARMARTLEDRQREIRLARSNLFEARRLFELLGASPRLTECVELDAKMQPARPAAASE